VPADNLSLVNLGGGAAAEQFAEALEKVLTNIADRNTDYKPSREVVLHVRLLPKEDRKRVTLRFWVTNRLVPWRVFESDAVLGITPDGELAAREIGVTGTLFNEMGGPAPGVVAPEAPAEPPKLHAVNGDRRE